MIKFENVEVMGWEAAIRGMRNPMNSWDKSDSKQIGDLLKSEEISPGITRTYWEPCIPYTSIGENDFALMKKLVNAGTDHRKFMRMITVYLDVTAPLYWWKEFDTYKVGTVANSCSTMHKIADKEFTLEDFSCEHLISDWIADNNDAFWYSDPPKNGSNECPIIFSPLDALIITIGVLNTNREAYLKTKDKKFWWQMIQLLPSSYNQRRTIMLNYEVLANIYKSRRNHKLDEWVEFCKWIENLPYSELITGRNDKKLKITTYDDNAGPIIPDLTPAQGKELTDAMSLTREENE